MITPHSIPSVRPFKSLADYLGDASKRPTGVPPDYASRQSKEADSAAPLGGIGALNAKKYGQEE